ncbi:MAG: hypothetical protein HY220_03100 [Candidatus Sungbacteria bacterium]|uniref:Uncharacterized protein n=1 Tax=Candidatus Sungiibacteriota bacterium TaxID=2750080 RepID=A0A9D6QYS3_9BACT|nr:hypothetical protein [Candidatus Sungbacteria bacterium]
MSQNLYPAPISIMMQRIHSLKGEAVWRLTASITWSNIVQIGAGCQVL